MKLNYLLPWIYPWAYLIRPQDNYQEISLVSISIWWNTWNKQTELNSQKQLILFLFLSQRQEEEILNSRWWFHAVQECKLSKRDVAE